MIIDTIDGNRGCFGIQLYDNSRSLRCLSVRLTVSPMKNSSRSVLGGGIGST